MFMCFNLAQRETAHVAYFSPFQDVLDVGYNSGTKLDIM